MGIRDLLGRRDFRHLLVGQAVSSLGDWMGTLALLYLVLELSGSTTAVGGVLVLRLLPSALGAPFAARVVTGWPRRNVMMTADLIRAGMAFALPVLPHLWWVYLWAFAIEVVGLPFLPARDAALPLLIEDREGGHDPRTLELANGITLGTQYGMIPLGAGLLGLLTWLAGSLGVAGHWVYVLVFWLDALSYLVSYLAIRSIPDLGPRHGDENGEGGMGGAERGVRCPSGARPANGGAVSDGTLIARGRARASSPRCGSPSCAGSCRGWRSWRSGWGRCSRSGCCSSGTSCAPVRSGSGCW